MMSESFHKIIITSQNKFCTETISPVDMHSMKKLARHQFLFLAMTAGQLMNSLKGEIEVFLTGPTASE